MSVNGHKQQFDISTRIISNPEPLGDMQYIECIPIQRPRLIIKDAFKAYLI